MILGSAAKSRLAQASVERPECVLVGAHALRVRESVLARLAYGALARMRGVRGGGAVTPHAPPNVNFSPAGEVIPTERAWPRFD
jgi:hypothetical protein